MPTTVGHTDGMTDTWERNAPVLSAEDLVSRWSTAGATTPGQTTDPSPLVLLDVRWTLAGSDLNAYLDGHIPGALFLDLDRDLADEPGAGGRHPLPDPRDLQKVWRSCGIDDDSSVVVYDGGNGLPAARAWWLLRWSGLTDVRVLDGGWPAWQSAGGAVETGPGGAATRPGRVTVRPGAMPVVDIDEAAALADGSDSSGGRLLDARAPERFRGDVEPMDPVAGHIPGAVNLPSALLTRDGQSTFRSADELRAVFAEVGVTANGPRAAASCGSGITAAQTVLAAAVVGVDVALFPGSYSQWCAQGRDVATGDD